MRKTEMTEDPKTARLKMALRLKKSWRETRESNENIYETDIDPESDTEVESERNPVSRKGGELETQKSEEQIVKNEGEEPENENIHHKEVLKTSQNQSSKENSKTLGSIKTYLLKNKDKLTIIMVL